jgi:hypothetical protein
MLIAAVMVLTMIPTVVVTVAAVGTPPEPGTHNVNIIARCAENWDMWRSDDITIDGEGTFEGTLNFNGDAPTNLVGLVITSDISWTDPTDPTLEDVFEESNFRFVRQDYQAGLLPVNPEVPDEWAEYALEIESIVVNGSINMSSRYSNFLKRQERGGTAHIIGFAFVELWNGWHTPHNTLAVTNGGDIRRGPSPDAADAESFWLPNDVPFESITIRFRVFDRTDTAAALAPTTDSTDVRLVSIVNNVQVQSALPTTITGNGDFSVSLNINTPIDRLGRLAILSDGGTLSPVAPFVGIARPAPTAWSSQAHMIITRITINGDSIVSSGSPTTRWHQRHEATVPEGQNSHLIAQPSADGSFNAAEGYVDIQLWNSYHEDSRVLNNVMQFPTIHPDTGAAEEPIDFGRGLSTNITSIVVEFRVEGLAGDTPPETCPDCGEEVAPGATCPCQNQQGDHKCAVCSTDLASATAVCANFCSTGLVTADSRAGGTRRVEDALAILRNLVGLDSEITAAADCPARRASLIVPASRANPLGQPDVDDALQILRGLVGLSTVWST